MNIPEIGAGLVFGTGKTNLRVAQFEPSGEIMGELLVLGTPTTPKEFFAYTGRTILEAAADKGARWAVLGVAGPVSVKVDAEDGVTQNLRVTNIRALKRKRGFDPVREMTKHDPAVGKLLNSGEFTFLTVNDGDLAAQAGAKLFAEEQDSVVADIIDGSGTGGAAVIRDTRFEEQLFHPLPGIWEMGHIPVSLDHPASTPEQSISGTALDGKFDRPIRDLEHNNPVFRTIARGMANIAIVFGVTAAPDLIVISGGIGIEAQDKFKEALEAEINWFTSSDNPMADKVAKARIVYPDVSMADTYELYGAPGAMRSHLTSRIINQLVRNTS